MRNGCSGYPASSSLIYLLVIQDYFTKWAEAISLPNQTANRITSELIRVFSNYGLPDILHSDQGRNFESSILRQTLEAFGIKKIRTTAYHPQGNALIVHYYNYFVHMLNARQNGSNTYHLCCLHIAPRFIPQWVYHRLNLCMVGHLHTIHFPPPQHMTQYLTKASYDPNYHNYLI